jgi:hypothetical protein
MVSLISNAKILVTGWEVHDVVAQLVRSHIQDKLGREVLSFQSNPAVDLSIWFRGPEWIVVRVCSISESVVEPPDTIADITNRYFHLTKKCYFASVNIASAQTRDGGHDVSFTRDRWRGYKMAASCNGLRAIADE